MNEQRALEVLAIIMGDEGSKTDLGVFQFDDGIKQRIVISDPVLANGSLFVTVNDIRFEIMAREAEEFKLGATRQS